MIKKLFSPRKDFENPDIVEEVYEDETEITFADSKSEMEDLQEAQQLSTNNQNEKITKNSTIGDVVEKYPEIIETLTSFGVHCVGCHVSPFETLETGFKGHGMSDEDVEQAVIKLNEVIETSKNEP
mgnify:CR=1 FL=1